MGLYSKQGLYAGYKKNQKEREKLDYYATPTQEVENILNILNIDFSNKKILDPQCGGGHMLEGIQDYIKKNNFTNTKIFGTDIQDRGYTNEDIDLQYGIDFLSDDYPVDKADIVVMNPPYSIIEPCLIRALEIAQDYLIVLCRTQMLEGQSRFKNVFKDNPPTTIYQYIDRISCYKNGITLTTPTSVQAYAWFIWDKNSTFKDTSLKWIERIR